jgi:type IV pilus assembly protein PilO
MALDIKLDTIMKLPLSQRLMILAGINILIAFFAYQVLLSPKQEEINRFRGKFEEVSKKLNESRVIARDIPKFERQKAELEAKLKEALGQLPNEKEIPDLIDNISMAAKGSGLTILLFKPMPVVPKGFYAEVPVNMAVKGKYESIFFFSDFEP